jgi:hypothetical protein
MLQRADGDGYYVGCSAKEFLAIFKKHMKPAVEEVVRQHPSIFRQGLVPVYCMDNDSIHQKAYAELDNMGVIRLQHPAKSPDFNQPIEHVFALLKAEMQAELRANTRVKSMPGYLQLAQKLFMTKVTASGVGRDVASMPDFWQAVVHAEGDWPKNHKYM